MKLEFRSTVKLPEGPSPAQTISFSGEFCIVGRTEGNVLLSEPRCSKRHCVIFQSHEGKLMVKDFGSTNGTYLNGKRCDESELKIGDQLRIGKTVLTLVDFDPVIIVAPPLPQSRTLTATKTHVGTEPEPIAIKPEPVENTGTGSVILRGWPHGWQAMPKEKADKFLEYVDTEGTKARISLADLQKKKTG